MDYGQRWKLRRYEADLYVGAVSFHGDIGLANKPFANNVQRHAAQLWD